MCMYHVYIYIIYEQRIWALKSDEHSWALISTFYSVSSKVAESTKMAAAHIQTNMLHVT